MTRPRKLKDPADLPELIRDSGFAENRMLVAQAQCEDLTLVTRDARCQQYDVAVLPA